MTERSRRRWTIIWTAVLVVGISALVYYVTRGEPDPALDGPPEKIIVFIAGDRFTTLPEQKQVAYVERITKLSMPELIIAAGAAKLNEEQRRQAFSNGRNAWLALHSQECFKMPPGPQRDAYLDDLAQSVPVRIAAANGGWARNPGNKALTPKMVKDWIESVPPTRRALAAEFASELEKRGAFKQ